MRCAVGGGSSDETRAAAVALGSDSVCPPGEGTGQPSGQRAGKRKEGGRGL